MGAASFRGRSTGTVALVAMLAVTAAGSMHAQRRSTDFAVARQKPLWTRIDPDGTTIGSPNWIIVHDGRVYLNDYDGPAVLALDARTGRTLWRYAREGRGPGEFRHPAFVFWHPRGVAVVDNDTRRLYLLSPEGVLLAERGVPRGLFIGGACSLDDGSMILDAAVLGGPSLYRARFGETSSDVYRFPFDTAGGHPNHRALSLASTARGSGCFAARKVTAGMAVLAAAGPGPARGFIESPKERPFKDASMIRDTSDLPIQFALRSGVSGDTAFVWFGGTKCHSRCIDFYSLPDLRYLHTIRLDGRTGINMHNLAIEGDLVVMLGSRDDVPLVAAYRLPRPRAR